MDTSRFQPGALLCDANLSGISLADADLRGADLSRAVLTGADLSGANLRGSHLAGADLSGAVLVNADLTGVRTDAHTRWPAEFDLMAHQRASTPLGPRTESKPVDAEARVLAAYFEEGRLKQLPLHSDRKKIIVLRQLIRSFALNRRYTEKEVSEILAAFHPDFASLRRMLVDYRFMNRTKVGIYWRTWVEVTDYAAGETREATLAPKTPSGDADGGSASPSEME